MTDGFTVVALAGGILEAEFQAAGYNVPNKAYLQIDGELMLVRVLRALRNASAVKEIRCVTPALAAVSAPAVAQTCDKLVEPGEDLIQSMIAGMAGLPADERVLVTATDIPLLTSSAVDDFASLANRTPCDVGYGCVERALHDAAYPEIRHTWVRLRDGTFCGAGMSVIRVGSAAQMEQVLRGFTSARKSPARLAALFSPALVIKLLTGRLTVAELERRADELTGLTCRGIMCHDPAIAVNVDRLSDLRAVESLLESRS